MRPLWEAEPEYDLAPGCRCLMCWSPTGRWQVDHEDVEQAPFVIGSQEEAELLAAWLNVAPDREP